ncbi:hypothetical protein QQ045_007743 [Rhodiola kirilowii]
MFFEICRDIQTQYPVQFRGFLVELFGNLPDYCRIYKRLTSATSVRSIAILVFSGNMKTPNRNTSSQPSFAGQSSNNSRGKGIGRGTGRGGARNVTYMPIQRTSNLSAVRPPRQQNSASTDGRTNQSGDYIPQPVAPPSPHMNDTNMDAQQQRDNEDWDIDGLLGLLQEQDEDNGENGEEDVVPDSQLLQNNSGGPSDQNPHSQPNSQNP